MSKKIGIMGGTFNPIHNAHIMMAQAAYEQYELDEVWFMPSKNPPHKKKKSIASDEHRRRMIESAIQNIPHFCFSDLELMRSGVTYTSDTVCQLHRDNPELEIYFILGGDSLIDLKKWYKPKRILRHCRILAAPRGHCTGNTLSIVCEKTGNELGGEIFPLDMPCISISSQMLRKSLREGNAIHGYCPEKVDRYIQIHGLYGCKKKKFHLDHVSPELIRALEACLPPGRFQHTLGVAHTASSLAACHGEDAGRAELAGMLHDCAKYYTGQEMIAICEKRGIPLSPLELDNTALIHGKLGAWLAGKRFGIDDEEILSAIRCHTTGCPAMTKLEKILFVADYIEPGRDMDCSPHSLEDIRRQCFCDLDRGVLMVLENTLPYLEQRNRPIDPMTEETYQYYKKAMWRSKQI